MVSIAEREWREELVEFYCWSPVSSPQTECRTGVWWVSNLIGLSQEKCVRDCFEQKGQNLINFWLILNSIYKLSSDFSQLAWRNGFAGSRAEWPFEGIIVFRITGICWRHFMKRMSLRKRRRSQIHTALLKNTGFVWAVGYQHSYQTDFLSSEHFSNSKALKSMQFQPDFGSCQQPTARTSKCRLKNWAGRWGGWGQWASEPHTRNHFIANRTKFHKQ